MGWVGRCGGPARHGATRCAQKRGSPLWATPRLGADLLVEAAAEAVFHAAGEGAAGALRALLARPATRFLPGLLAAARRPPRTGDGEHDAAEHHDETDYGQNRKAADLRGWEGNARNQHCQTDHEESGALDATP